MVDPLPLQLGIPGGPELLVILLIAVLLFGANKIPKLARSTGQAMGEFKRGRQQVEEELKEFEEVADPEADIVDEEDDEYMDLDDEGTTTTGTQTETETSTDEQSS